MNHITVILDHYLLNIYLKKILPNKNKMSYKIRYRYTDIFIKTM